MTPQFVLFGDSITELSFRPGGWGAALADTYSRKADVVDRDYGGITRDGHCLWLNHLFPLARESTTVPAAVTIFFGANDAALLGIKSEHQHVPVDEYKENLKKIVTQLKNCSPKILIGQEYAMYCVLNVWTCIRPFEVIKNEDFFYSNLL